MTDAEELARLRQKTRAALELANAQRWMLSHELIALLEAAAAVAPPEPGASGAV